jgi:putative transcriptional regulator
MPYVGTWSQVLQTRLDELLGDRSRYWLARETGISEGNLRKLARGQTTSIKFENLEKICKALGCMPGDLLVLSQQEVEPKLGTAKKKTEDRPQKGR